MSSVVCYSSFVEFCEKSSDGEILNRLKYAKVGDAYYGMKCLRGITPLIACIRTGKTLGALRLIELKVPINTEEDQFPLLEALIQNNYKIFERLLPNSLLLTVASTIAHVFANMAINSTVFDYVYDCLVKFPECFAMRVRHEEKEEFIMLRIPLAISQIYSTREAHVKVDLWNKFETMIRVYTISDDLKIDKIPLNRLLEMFSTKFPWSGLDTKLNNNIRAQIKYGCMKKVPLPDYKLTNGGELKLNCPTCGRRNTINGKFIPLAGVAHICPLCSENKDEKIVMSTCGHPVCKECALKMIDDDQDLILLESPPQATRSFGIKAKKRKLYK
jgi:hypothetical protein